MKYRLRKDLPFAKAGTEISNDFVQWYVMTNRNWVIGFVDETDRLISEGWIEEVKPREWWVVTHTGSHEITLESHIPERCKEKGCEFIKVREVIG